MIHRDTTLNFSANENFVCLICVHFLLKKGYEAKHIVFEPAFKVGHVNKPSYGDILVFDKEYNPLVLIENKTFGTEFSKEWNLMQKDGGQLFSYLGPLVNEMGLCENLALFAADFDDIDIIPKSHIITLRDNEKRIAELENPKTFADAKGKYFEVWNETYAKSFETKGLFEDDIAPYTIGKLKYTISDLKGLSHAEIKPIYHEFLGYDWSNRKGDEGIKYVTDKKIEDLEDDDEKDAEVVMAINSIKYIKTPLYNPNDVNDNTKYSYAFRSHIEENCSKFSFGKVIQKKEEPFDGDINKLFSIKKLSDLIDFSNANFDKKINLNATENKIIKTKWPTQRIEKLLNKVKGNKTKIPQNEIMENGKIPVVSQNRNGIIEGYTDYEEVITDLPLIVFGDHSCAIKYIDFPFVRGADGTQLIKVNEEKIKSQYLYYYLNSIQIENADKYERHFKYLKTTLVPIPPISVQNKIIDKCIAVDAEIKKANEKIGDLEEKINALVKNINGVKYKLGKIAQFKNGLNYDKSSAGEEVSIVGVADFKDNKSPIWDDVEKVVINGKLEDSFLLQKNDLLTVRSNGSQELVGRFMIVNKDLEEKTTFSGFTIRVRPDSEVVKSEFLYYILSSPIIRKQLVVGSNGSNIKSLNQTLLANVEISIPSMKKQEEILSELLAIENQIIEQRSIIEFGQEKKNRIIEDELI